LISRAPFITFAVTKFVPLLEDSCESLGSICGSKKLGSFGLASSFSFYYGHHISTIEGGAVSQVMMILQT
tara:strand:+ start:906 stop:1115 length:210 start_codon:yes stop_codon:yes gene_type:complete